MKAPLPSVLKYPTPSAICTGSPVSRSFVGVERLRQERAVLDEEQMTGRRIRHPRMHLRHQRGLRRIERRDIHASASRAGRRLDRHRHVQKMPAVGQELRPVVIQLALGLVDLRDARRRSAIGSDAIDAVPELRKQDGAVAPPGRRALSCAAQIVRAGPPVTSTFFSSPSPGEKNPMKRLSGDQNGETAPSVPGSGSPSPNRAIAPRSAASRQSDRHHRQAPAIG